VIVQRLYKPFKIVGLCARLPHRIRRRPLLHPVTKKLVEYGFVGLVIATAIIVGAQFRPASILPSNGILQIRITDDPLVVTCPGPHAGMNLTSLTVTLTSVEARTTEALRLTGEWVPVSNATTTIDIFRLGDLTPLIGSTSVPESTITSVRLNVALVAATTSLGAHPPLVLSSDKLEVPLGSNGEVRTGMTTSVVIGFHHIGCEGNGTLRLTPVLTATSSGPK
jgi:hypothetical protein